MLQTPHRLCCTLLDPLQQLLIFPPCPLTGCCVQSCAECADAAACGSTHPGASMDRSQPANPPWVMFMCMDTHSPSGSSQLPQLPSRQCWAQRGQSCANTDLLLQSAWPQLVSTGRNWKWSTAAWPDQARPCSCHSPIALLKLQKLSMDSAPKSNPLHLFTHNSWSLVPKNFRVVPFLNAIQNKIRVLICFVCKCVSHSITPSLLQQLAEACIWLL